MTEEKKPRRKPDGKCIWGCGRVTTNRCRICNDCLDARPNTWEEWIAYRRARTQAQKPRGKSFKKAKMAANFARPEEISGELEGNP